jgi:vacuolar protein sorting-associated protein 13A/C
VCLQVGVHIQLTHSTLTKQVVFMPYYVIVNNASYIIECQEADRPADPWIKVNCATGYSSALLWFSLLKVVI